LLVATEKTGHEVKADKPERMFILCEENFEEYHNIKVSNTSFCVDITKKKKKKKKKKIETAFTNKQRAFKNQ